MDAYDYDRDSVYAFLNKDIQRKTVIYARVSTSKQKKEGKDKGINQRGEVA